jgi:hypothetical protein
MEDFEDTKRLVRIRKSKDSQYNGQVNKDKQRSTKHVKYIQLYYNCLVRRLNM